MTFLETVKHYNELIANRIDDLENALDDDCPDIQSDIEALIEEFYNETLIDLIPTAGFDKADFMRREIKEDKMLK